MTTVDDWFEDLAVHKMDMSSCVSNC